MRKALIALALADTVSTGTVAAQTPPAAPMAAPPGVGPMGANMARDGIVTREDYLADAARRFAEMDTDRDGRITAGERMAYREAMRDRRIADGGATPPPPPPPPPPPAEHRGHGPDGRGPGGGRDMTRDDYMARAGERFDRMDTNHDGRLDPTEMAAMRAMRQGDRREGGATPPPPPPGAE